MKALDLLNQLLIQSIPVVLYLLANTDKHIVSPRDMFFPEEIFYLLL